MAEFEGSEEEFKETFMSNFQVSFSDLFGSVHTHNLKEGGDEIAVTKDTCQVGEHHVAVTEHIVHVIHIVYCFQVCGRLLSSITHLSCALIYHNFYVVSRSMWTCTLSGCSMRVFR